MEDLKELVIQTLESSGQLGTLRAQLRSAVFKIIDGQESGRGVQWENPIAMKAMESATGQIACELFRDFLEQFKMDYTLNVFIPECNLPNEKKNRVELCKKLGLSQEIQGPLLFALIDRGSNVSMEKQQLGNEKPQVIQIQSASQQPPQQQNIQQNIQQPGFQQKQPEKQVQQQVKQEVQATSTTQKQQQQQQVVDNSKQVQQQPAQTEKNKQTQQQQLSTDKQKQTQQLQQPIEKPKLEPLPDIKGNKMGKLPPLNIQDDSNEQERKRLADIQSKIEEMEKKEKGNVLAEFRQQEEEEDQYSEEIEEDIEADEEEEDVIKQGGEAESSSRKQVDSMGISSSLGMDPSVDSLELEKYDYVEKIQKVKQ